MFLQVSVCPRGGVGIPGCIENPRPEWRTPPLDGDPPDGDPPDGDPPGMESPPWMENPPWMETPPGWRPPRWRTPPGWRPPDGDPPDGEPPPPTVNVRAVRILLECILVFYLS